MKKTPFNTKELKEYKTLLLDMKQEILSKLSNIGNEKITLENGSGDFADQASELQLHELQLNLTEQDSILLEKIESALTRIDNKTYGICIDTGQVIPKARLQAMPYAKRTADAEEKFNRLQNSKNKRILNRLYQ